MEHLYIEETNRVNGVMMRCVDKSSTPAQVRVVSVRGRREGAFSFNKEEPSSSICLVQNAQMQKRRDCR
jgi:hypothetical protein